MGQKQKKEKTEGATNHTMWQPMLKLSEDASQLNSDAAHFDQAQPKCRISMQSLPAIGHCLLVNVHLFGQQSSDVCTEYENINSVYYIGPSLACPAASIVTRSKKYVHTTPILKDLYWLLVNSGLTSDFSLTYFCFHGTAPQYMTELIPAHALRTLSVTFHHSRLS